MPRWELRAEKAAIVIASSVLVMSAAIEIEARRDGLCTIFNGSTRRRNDFRGKIFTSHEVGYSEESDMSGSIVHKCKIV